MSDHDQTPAYRRQTSRPPQIESLDVAHGAALTPWDLTDPDPTASVLPPCDAAEDSSPTPPAPLIAAGDNADLSTPPGATTAAGGAFSPAPRAPVLHDLSAFDAADADDPVAFSDTFIDPTGSVRALADSLDLPPDAMDDASDALPVNPDQPILAEAPLLALCDPPLTPRRYTGGGWTIAAMCAGIAILACCIIIPQAEANRRLAYERLKLQDDLNQIQKQSAVNQDFLDKLATDPTLAQRLAQRQMKVVRRGTQVLPLPGMDNWNNTSPFSLVKVPAPPPLPAYTPVPGRLSQLCNDPHSRIYLLGAGMLLVAAGLVLGYSPKGA